jgi:hypothetical protein
MPYARSEGRPQQGSPSLVRSRDRGGEWGSVDGDLRFGNDIEEVGAETLPSS